MTERMMRSLDNLDAVMQSQLIKADYRYKSGNYVYYRATLPDEREELALYCENDPPECKLSFQLRLPVFFDESTEIPLKEYIDRINRSCGDRGVFDVFDEDIVSVTKELSYKRFFISRDLINHVIWSLKANAFDFSTVLNSIAYGIEVIDDHSIASELYFDLYPEKKPADTEEAPWADKDEPIGEDDFPIVIIDELP